ncbi:stage 0 sporulation protein [bacterium]|nr:stage 0 sporulation protein [bacterium]
MNKSNGNNTGLEPDYYIVYFKGFRADYYIDRNHLGLKRGEWVILQSEKGRDIGQILSGIRREVFEKNSTHKYPLEILRRAEKSDLEHLERLHRKEKEVLSTCQEYIDFRGLDMKLVDAEYQFDGSKLTIYFTADERVDFRELVKDLAATYRTRIELRQIGVRDEVKRIGGIGPCGHPTCCSRFLQKFEPISTQMAREQNLVVNPSKISGLCERLMCCLAFEAEHYQEFQKRFPTVGETYQMEDGRKLFVKSVDYFRDKILVKDVDNDDFYTISSAEFRRNVKGRKDFLKKWLSSKSGSNNQGKLQNG